MMAIQNQSNSGPANTTNGSSPLQHCKHFVFPWRYDARGVH